MPDRETAMPYREREALFDRLDAFLAGAPACTKPHETRDPGFDCPDCGLPGSLLKQHHRYGPRGVAYCPQCGWADIPC